MSKADKIIGFVYKTTTTTGGGQKRVIYVEEGEQKDVLYLYVRRPTTNGQVNNLRLRCKAPRQTRVGDAQNIGGRFSWESY